MKMRKKTGRLWCLSIFSQWGQLSQEHLELLVIQGCRIKPCLKKIKQKQLSSRGKSVAFYCSGAISMFIPGNKTKHTVCIIFLSLRYKLRKEVFTKMQFIVELVVWQQATGQSDHNAFMVRNERTLNVGTQLAFSLSNCQSESFYLSQLNPVTISQEYLETKFISIIQQRQGKIGQTPDTANFIIRISHHTY